MEEKSEVYKHYSTDGGDVTGVAGYIFLFTLNFNTRLTFAFVLFYGHVLPFNRGCAFFNNL